MEQQGKLPAYEVDHVDEVVHVPGVPCSDLDVYNLGIETFEYGIGPEGGEVVEDLLGIPHQALADLADLPY